MMQVVSFGSDCETCAQITRDLRLGESSVCPCCRATIRMPGQKDKPQKPVEHEGRLLRDCSMIAAWDAISNARAQTMGDSSGVPEDPEVPAWDEHRYIVRIGRPLRGTLDALLADGRAQSARLHEISPTERAGAVITWLVPRARTYLHSAGGGLRPVLRNLPHDLAQAFTIPEQWATWNPSPPAPLVTPKNRPRPEPVAPPREPDADAAWWQRRLYVETTLPAYLVKIESFPTTLEAWERRFDTWPAEQRQQAELVARYARAVEAGKVGIRRTGIALLKLAETTWARIVSSSWPGSEQVLDA